ncbi:E3 ubiquitin-protein ligase Topors [Drosophila albomicans]|uniref:E3 ubiquitin-protein ligase Topors n=1 Tax=Drosophila albomicans TaxID=7291 RepID=A0A6P8YFV1_DROAB|nr:E3 ubiquitin-protein ligase Topors [Drosophila albomicans]
MAESLLLGEAPPSIMEDMASSVIVEPPAVSDTVGGGTLPALAAHFADLTESGSESGDEPSVDARDQQEQETGGSSDAVGENNATAGRSSPPPNCAICLSRCRRKCFTDSCMHQFCFKCLCEWSKIKPECPLCKQPFKTIIHNVRTLDDYDRYPVQPSSPESSLSFHIVNIRRERLLLQNQAVMTNGGDNGDDIDTAATDESQDGIAAHGQQHQAGSRGLYVPHNRFEPYRMELLNFYRHDQDARGGGSLSMLWRRYVYDRKLYALPVSDNLTGNFREWSARFYRDNPAQMHRLMPWINRDIVCLLRTSPQNVTQVMHMMHDILPMINITTRTFRRRLSPFLGERTNHFIHELFNFARSPYDMIGYDRVVQYSALVAEEVEVDLLDLVSTNEGSSSTLEPTANGNETTGNGAAGGTTSSNSSETTATTTMTTASEWSSRMPRPSTSVIVTNPSATHSFSVTMATDGSELPGISIRRTTTSNVGSQTVAINLSMRRPANEVIEIDDGDAAANAEVAAINDGSSTTGRRQAGASLPISAHIELQSSDCSNSSDDDDECVFVLERKPPHLRTPELVSLDSNSDSDVVFVDEQKASPVAKANGGEGDGDSVSIDQEMETAVNELFMGPSTSTGVCSTAGKNWMLVLEEARRHDPMCLRSRSKRNLTRTQQRAAPKAPTSSSEGTRWSTSSDSSSSSEDSAAAPKRRKRRAARKPKAKAQKRPASSKRSAQQLKSKRRRKQVSEVEEEAEAAAEEEKEKATKASSNSSSSSSSSSEDSSEDGAAGDSTEPTGNNYNNENSSSSSSSDDDQDFNTLRKKLKAKYFAKGNEDTKPPKKELVADTAGEETLEHQAPEEEVAASSAQHAVVKRRRSNSSSNQSSSHSHSNSAISTLASHNTTMSSSSVLSLFNNNIHRDVGEATSAERPLSMVATANSLLELSTLSVGGAGSGLFNEQSLGVEDAMRYLQNALPSASDDAQLGIYSDASNELQHYRTEADAEPELAIDVVGEATSNAAAESADVILGNDIEPENENEEIDNEHEEIELGNQQDEPDEEEHDEQDQEEENDEDYEDEDEAAAAATAESDQTDSDPDPDAY